MNAQHNIFSVFQTVAEKQPGHTAVIYLGTRYSYAKVRRMADSFAAALIDKGLTAGQRVVIYVPNSIQWVVAWLGIQRAGCVCVPITPIYTPHDLAYIANDSGAEAIVCADTNFGYVKKVLPETRLKQVFITKWPNCCRHGSDGTAICLMSFPPDGPPWMPTTYPFGSLLGQYRGRTGIIPDNGTDGSRTAEILYTGGTTKHPKGVPINHDLFLLSADEQIRVSEPLFPPEENIILGNAPLFHILGQTCSLATLLVGGTLMLQPRVNLDATFDAIHRFQARTMIGVPTLYRMMLEHDRSTSMT